MADHDTHTVEREIHHVEEPRRGGLLTGFVIAVLVIAATIVGYLVISDDDADGQIDLDVPSVDVDVEE